MLSFRKNRAAREARLTELRAELARRMARPQRHRLLQGYPMAPLLRRTGRRLNVIRNPSRPLIVGVLPHTFCNPKVRGCGFCTFPHEKFGKEPMREVVEQVCVEIERAAKRDPTLRERRVDAVYFGGGTANLTPPEELAALCSRLSEVFELGGAELTLEGVPRYFRLHDDALLEVLARAGVRHRRISMGVQTFDDGWLRRMGRDAFGDRDEIGGVVAAAHARGFTASADLLFNLPGAPRELSLADVETAIELGFDQICLYNLVLTPDLGTEWASDGSLLEARPDQDTALATWLALREHLLARGFEQTTLTNFERADVAQSPKRFVYERASFDPATYDAIGFGPGAISTFTAFRRPMAQKTMNVGTSAEFAAKVREGDSPVDGFFLYTPQDLRLLHLTRGLSRGVVDRAAYKRAFRAHALEEFAPHWQVLEEAGLILRDKRELRLSPKGMFYADSVAGLLSHERVVELRATPAQDYAEMYPMG